MHEQSIDLALCALFPGTIIQSYVVALFHVFFLSGYEFAQGVLVLLPDIGGPLVV